MKIHISIPEFCERFSIEGNRSALTVDERWNDDAHCPHGRATRIRWLENKMGFKCGRCIKRFGVRNRTSPKSFFLPLQAWLLAINWMMTAHRSISIAQFAEELGVAQKKALFLEHHTREAYSSVIPVLSKEVEIDKTYLDGNRRKLTRRVAFSMQPVIGTNEHGGSLREIPIERQSERL